jgi:pimeloyl-ACP methyl ester carboxylesterase
MRLVRKMAVGLIGLHCLSLAAQAPPAQQLPDSQRQLYFLDQKHSAIIADGRRLHVVCSGTGSPTVVLTAGLGGNALDWNTVQPQVGRTTRVCAWDRPGHGLSEGTQADQTILTTTSDIEAALAALSILPPYVMVGHSLGAYETLLFADRNRGKVSGIVLVDPSMPDQQKTFERVFRPELIRSRLEPLQRSVELLRNCAGKLRAGQIRPGRADPENCFRQPGWYSPEVVAAIQAQAADPAYLESAASFLSNSSRAGALVVNTRRSYGSLPLVVLTAVNVTVWPGMTEVEEAVMAEEWNLAHDALAALSTKGVNARIPGAGHLIHVDKPQVVIDAIEAVVREAREAAE